jgi:hypothetical protein
MYFVYNTVMKRGGTTTPQLPEVSDEAAQQTSDEPEALVAPEEQAGIDGDAPDSNWQVTTSDDPASKPAFPTHPVVTVSWSASEYVAHDKNMGWYALVVLGSGVVAAVVYLITRDVISTSVMVILGITFAAFGARKPQVLEYAVDGAGIRIGPRHYPYSKFKTFSIIEEDAVRSILLMPLQRFNLPVAIYYNPEEEEKIIQALGVYLPHEDRQAGPIDSLMRKIHF